jgi:hypothetical protein
VDGFQRLVRSRWYHERCAAIEAQVKAEYEFQLSTAQGYWGRASIRRKISLEISRRLDSVASPDSLF